MGPEQIQRAIDQLPRHSLLHLPTPLQPCPRLSEHMGGPRIWIKRDDLSGLAFGGNKSRYLEFTLAAATAQGCNAVVLSAVVQSNHCRQFAAAAARLGLKAVVVLRQDESAMGSRDPATGNYLLDHLFGAEVRIAAPDQARAAIAEEMQRLKGEGYQPFTGLSAMLSRVAYIQCALEIVQQCADFDIQPGRLFISSGSNSLAGLVAGFALLDRPIRFVGTPQSKLGAPDEAASHIVSLAQEAVEGIGLSCALDPACICVDDRYVGPGFGYLDAPTLETIRLLARNEGLLVDPTYSGKGFAALLDHIRRGHLSDDDDVIFVHTGGTPLTFVYGEELL